MTKRLACCVPSCRRTTKHVEYGDWVCGKHWPAVSATWRRRLSKLVRRYRKRFGDNSYWAYPPGSPDRLEAVRIYRLWSKLWERCKRQAIERAMGIG